MWGVKISPFFWIISAKRKFIACLIVWEGGGSGAFASGQPQGKFYRINADAAFILLGDNMGQFCLGFVMKGRKACLIE